MGVSVVSVAGLPGSAVLSSPGGTFDEIVRPGWTFDKIWGAMLQGPDP